MGKTKVVFKYVIPANDVATIRMPINSELLTVHAQRNDICLWALVDPDEQRTEDVTFRIAGTGHILANGKFFYIGTVFFAEAQLVFHVFEAKK